MQSAPRPEHRPSRTSAPPLRRALAAVAVGGMGILVGACAQDTASDGVAPEDAEVSPPQQPGGGDDPTLSGEGGEGVSGGNTGGDGSGAPDSGAGDDGSAGDSPSAGENG